MFGEGGRWSVWCCAPPRRLTASAFRPLCRASKLALDVSVLPRRQPPPHRTRGAVCARGSAKIAGRASQLCRFSRLSPSLTLATAATASLDDRCEPRRSIGGVWCVVCVGRREAKLVSARAACRFGALPLASARRHAARRPRCHAGSSHINHPMRLAGQGRVRRARRAGGVAARRRPPARRFDARSRPREFAWGSPLPPRCWRAHTRTRRTLHTMLTLGV